MVLLDELGLGHNMIRYGRMVNRNCEDQETNIEYFMAVWLRSLGCPDSFLPVSYVALIWV